MIDSLCYGSLRSNKKNILKHLKLENVLGNDFKKCFYIFLIIKNIKNTFKNHCKMYSK